jgi:hypothetical protein
MERITGITEVRITVRIEASGAGITEKDFYNVHDLANFLKEQDVVGQALGYVPKNKPQPRKPPVIIEELTRGRSKRPTAKQLNRVEASYRAVKEANKPGDKEKRE